MSSMKLQTSLLLTIFLINCAASDPQAYYIKHVESGLVLYAPGWDTYLKPKKPGNKHQIWMVEPVTPGKIRLKSPAFKDKVLDGQTGSRIGVRTITYSQKPWSNGVNQRFFVNVDGTIAIDQDTESDPPLFLTAQFEKDSSYCNLLHRTRKSDQIFELEPVV